MRRAVGLVLTLALAAAACGDGAEREAEPFQGTWYSAAFGSYVVIEGGSVHVYEATSVSCALVQRASAAGISEVASLADGRLRLADQGRELLYVRADALPALCEEEFSSRDPTRNLEVLLATFDEHYAFLAERAPEWDRQKAEVLGAVGPSTTPEQLFDVVTALLEPFGDAQIRLAVDDEDLIEGSLWPPEDADPLMARLRVDTVSGRFLRPGWGLHGADGIVVGRTTGGAGYLGLTRLVGFDDTPDESVGELASVVDGLLAEVGPDAGIVIDLRTNRGGFDVFAQVVASRFVTTERLVVTREARVAGTGEYVPAGELTVVPMPTGVYRGPVVLLTGPATAGSAEVLVLALRGEETVTIVGETTAGSLSPILARELPNGWVVGLSNQRVVDEDGIPWEVRGIPPDVVVPLTSADLDAGTDPALERADAILGS